MKGICDNFPISNEEYRDLEKEFSNLCKYASWQLLRMNAKNNHTDDFEDINQELVMSLIRAGSYFKRQIYIEDCLIMASKYVKDSFISLLVLELEDLWMKRTRHGANKQKFGVSQEKLLRKIIYSYVPAKLIPTKNFKLKIDSESKLTGGTFRTYAKAIIWNSNKSLGKKITKEKTIRTGCVFVRL